MLKLASHLQLVHAQFYKVESLLEFQSLNHYILLIRILPFVIRIVGALYYYISKIVDLVISPVSSPNLCAVLQATIERHHRYFIAMYTAEAVIPKFHFLLHYPKQILNVGPMIRTCNMRNEAKLTYISKHLG